jgi:hypothetical protein
MAGLYDGERTEPVGRGQAAWSRAGASAAVAARGTLGGVALEGGAVLAGAWRHISGRGFAEAESAWSFDPGAGLDARLGWRGRRAALWIDLGGMVWPRAQGVFVRGAMLEGELARWDLFVGLGAAFEMAVTRAPDPT